MASALGGIGLPQLVHVSNVIVAVFSLIIDSSGDAFTNVRLPYILYASNSKECEGWLMRFRKFIIYAARHYFVRVNFWV